MSAKVRYKMYKSKSKWVIAPVLFAGIGLGFSTQEVSADTMSTVMSSSVSTVSASSQAAKTDSTVSLRTSSVSTSNSSTSSATNSSSSVSSASVAKGSSEAVPSSSAASSSYSYASVKAHSVDVASQVNAANNSSSSSVSSLSVKTDSSSSSVASSSSSAASSSSSQKVTLNANGQKIANAAGLDPSKLTDAEIEALNKATYSDKMNDGQLTYKEYRQYAQNVVDEKPQYAIPQFDPNTIQNLPAATTKDAESGKVEDLDIWDSWPVVDASTGVPVNYHGYQMAVGMMGYHDDWNDGHLYLLYNKYDDQNLADWKCAGPIFGFNESDDYQHWSGSTIVNPDGSLQLYYTLDDHTDGNNNQELASATIDLNYGPDGITIKGVRNNHVLFKGDGYYYQTYDQWKTGKDASADDFCLRDPHVIDVDGKRYLVFEGNTGTYNYQGDDQVYNLNNYDEDTIAQDVQDMFKVVNNPTVYKQAVLANACIGLMQLGGDAENPMVAKLFAPIVSTPLVSDEIERPVIVPINGKYYLFTDTRLNRGIMDDLNDQANHKIGDNVGMLGFVADSLNGNYVPLNGNGTVLTASTGSQSRTSEYSWYAVPMPKKNGDNSNYVLITAYMSNRDEAAGAGKNSTWGPSFVVKINPDGTTEVLPNSVTAQQGIWHEPAPVENQSHQAVQASVAPKTAREAHENGNWYLKDDKGHNLTGFQYLPDQNKTVYYDPQTGAMVHGVHEIDGHYYDFDPITGALLYGDQTVDGHQVYCNPVMGMIMDTSQMHFVGQTNDNAPVDVTPVINQGKKVVQSASTKKTSAKASTCVYHSVNQAVANVEPKMKQHVVAKKTQAQPAASTYATRKAEHQQRKFAKKHHMPQLGDSRNHSEELGLTMLAVSMLGVGEIKKRKE